MRRSFVHLRVHSHYSLLSGGWPPEAVAAAAAAAGMDAVALTDTDALHGAVPFAKACAAAGVRPIVGAELTDPRRPWRAAFLARDADGYAELCRLVTARHVDPGFVLKDAMTGASERLVVLAREPRLLEAAAAARAAGGGPDVRADVRPAPAGDDPCARAERALRRETLAWAGRLSLPLVATTDAHYGSPADRPAHRVLRAIGANATLADLDRRAAVGERRPGDLETGVFAPGTAWFMTGSDLARAFADCPAALEGAAETAATCRFAFAKDGLHFPAYPTADGESAIAVLWRLAFEGLAARYRPLPAEAIRRLQEELAVIEETGFADLFLVIRDIARRAAAEHVPSVGRGSAANSLVAFCLGITHVDPLAHALFFERFLSRERSSPPDFDLDFCWRRRDRVIEDVYETFGEDRTAMIATFCRLGARGALREAARALGVPDREISRVTKRIPHFSSVAMLDELVDALPECRGLPLDRPPWDEALDLARAIDMAPRHVAVHPGGIVVGPEPLDRWAPRQRAAKGVLVTQFDMHAVEDVGLVKIDLLGNRGLSAIADVCDLLREAEGVTVEWTHDEDVAGDGWVPGEPPPEDTVLVNPFTDPETMRVMREGRTMGCFYIESPSMRALLKKLACDSFEMLTAASSIIRPGIADSGMMDAFVRRFRGEEEVTYLHPVMEELLGDTYGVMIYQEDVIKVVHRLAGMTLGEADGMRRSMTKKGEYDDLGTYRERFLAGTRRNGVEEEVAREIWRQIESFAGYSFCKAHSASYAQVSFRSAFLKARCPAAFMASTLANGGGFYPAFAYVEEARRIGLEILLPDVNRSAATWIAEGPDGRPAGEGTPVAAARAIRAGLGQVAEVTTATVERILADRAERGPYLSLAAFCERVPVGVPEIHRLIDAGGFDAFDLTRPQAKWKAEGLLRGWGRRGATPFPPPSLFPPGALAAREPPPVPALADYPVGERRRREYELLGVSPGHHPIEFHREAAARVRRKGRYGAPGIVAADLARHRGRRVTMVGVLTTTKRVRTKRAEPMMFLTLEDETAIWDVVLFPRVYQRDGARLDGRGPYVVTGRVEDDARPSSVTAERLERLEARA